MSHDLTGEQRLLVETVRRFVEQEMMPHEQVLEDTGELPRDLEQDLKDKSIELGLYACNLPQEVGGGGLGAVELTLIEKELGRTSLALAECCWRPLNILAACVGPQIETYLKPAVSGARKDCIAMTEPNAGSDLRGMSTTARRDGAGADADWLIRGEKHFISNAALADFAVLFAATGEEQTDKGIKKRISAFLVDLDGPGVSVEPGYRCVSHRGYVNNILRFDDARVPAWKLMGAEGAGFELVNQWLGPTRLTVAATCVGRAERAFGIALDWAATRRQFGQQIGKFQGISFPLADMATELRLGNLILMDTARRIDAGTVTEADPAMAKLYCSEMLARVADQSLQTVGGMGLMADLPLERIWRDARIERIWDGTSEIQRHIISRSLLRPLGA